MNPLRLYLSSLMARKVFLVFAVALPLLSIFLPSVAPAYLKPSLTEPARAQSAWILLWLVTVGWIFVEAPSTSHRWRRGGLFELLLPTMRGPFPRPRQLLLVSAGITLPAFILLLETVFICMFLCCPSDPGEAWRWRVTNLQYGILYLLVMAPLTLLAVSLGTLLNPVIAWIVVSTMLAYGLLVQESFAPFLSGGGPLSVLWQYALPHYHLADLTDRLVFKLGPLPTGTFVRFSAYFGGWGILLATFALVLYRPGRQG